MRRAYYPCRRSIVCACLEYAYKILEIEINILREVSEL